MNYFKRIIDLFTTHDFSESGKNAFYSWLIDKEHATEKNQALNDLWFNSGTNAIPDIWQSLNGVNKKIGKSNRQSWSKLRVWQVAAAIMTIALISTIYIYLSEDKHKPIDLIEEYVPTAEVKYVVLPDGSEVQLNSQSVLLYPKIFKGKNRSVYLMGEANFKVVHNAKRPFIVKASDFRITVLGTEFNVLAYPGDSIMRTSVLSGCVEVEFSHLQKQVTLTANKQLAYNRSNGESFICMPDMMDVTAWQRGELVFKSTTLSEIITMLERKYPYTFTYSLNSLKNDKYTFRFREKATLTEVMDIIVRVVGTIQYRIENGNCIIYAK